MSLYPHPCVTRPHSQTHHRLPCSPPTLFLSPAELFLSGVQTFSFSACLRSFVLLPNSYRIFFLHYYFLKKHKVNSMCHIPFFEPCFDRNATDPSHFKKMLVWLLKTFFNKTINCSIKLGKKIICKANNMHFCPIFRRKTHPMCPARLLAKGHLGDMGELAPSEQSWQNCPSWLCAGCWPQAGSPGISGANVVWAWNQEKHSCVHRLPGWWNLLFPFVCTRMANSSGARAASPRGDVVPHRCSEVARGQEGRWFISNRWINKE